MNIHDTRQIASITSLFNNQYADLLPAFEEVIEELRLTRTEVSLSELKQLCRQRTEPYATQLQNAITASEQEVIVSDILPSETKSSR